MRKILSIFAILAYFSGSFLTAGTHTLLRNANTIITGTLLDARLNSSSVTLQGNKVDISTVASGLNNLLQSGGGANASTFTLQGNNVSISTTAQGVNSLNQGQVNASSYTLQGNSVNLSTVAQGVNQLLQFGGNPSSATLQGNTVNISSVASGLNNAAFLSRNQGFTGINTINGFTQFNSTLSVNLMSDLPCPTDFTANWHSSSDGSDFGAGTYEFVIVALDKFHNESSSYTSSVFLTFDPGAGGAYFDFAWSAVPGAVSYRIYQGKQGNPWPYNRWENAGFSPSFNRQSELVSSTAPANVLLFGISTNTVTIGLPTIITSTLAVNSPTFISSMTVYGTITTTSGVKASNMSSVGIGVYGESNDGHGVYGKSASLKGVSGYSYGGGNDANGVFGLSIGNGGVGVRGEGSQANSIGVYASGLAYDFYGVGGGSYFGGNVNVSGAQTVGSTLTVSGSTTCFGPNCYVWPSTPLVAGQIIHVDSVSDGLTRLIGGADGGGGGGSSGGGGAVAIYEGSTYKGVFSSLTIVGGTVEFENSMATVTIPFQITLKSWGPVYVATNPVDFWGDFDSGASTISIYRSRMYATNPSSIPTIMSVKFSTETGETNQFWECIYASSYTIQNFNKYSMGDSKGWVYHDPPIMIYPNQHLKGSTEVIPTSATVTSGSWQWEAEGDREMEKRRWPQ